MTTNTLQNPDTDRKIPDALLSTSDAKKHSEILIELRLRDADDLSTNAELLAAAWASGLPKTAVRGCKDDVCLIYRTTAIDVFINPGFVLFNNSDGSSVGADVHDFDPKIKCPNEWWSSDPIAELPAWIVAEIDACVDFYRRQWAGIPDWMKRVGARKVVH